MSSTALRSVAITGSFLAYGVGCVGVYVVAYLVDDSQILIVSALGLFVLFTIPTILLIKETPRYFLKKGKISRLFDCLQSVSRINGTNVTREKLFEQLIAP